jgi:hypothetical protein
MKKTSLEYLHKRKASAGLFHELLRVNQPPQTCGGAFSHKSIKT